MFRQTLPYEWLHLSGSIMSLELLKSVKSRGFHLIKVPIPAKLASVVLKTKYIKCQHPKRNTNFISCVRALTKTDILAFLFWGEVTAQ